MTALRRLVLAWLAVVAAVLLTVAPAATAGAQGEGAETGAPTTPDSARAIDDLVGCVQGSRRLLVLMLIDESASLKQTDPDARRVDAARSALDSLVALSTSEGEASPDVDIAMAAFSNDYRLIQDWSPIEEDTTEELEGSLEEFRELQDGIDTDFVNALSTGREALASRAAEVSADVGDAPCKAVLLFTDGTYDIAVRPTAEDQDRLGLTKPYAPDIELTDEEAVRAAEKAGRAELCEPGGLADQLRNDEITLLTVALSGDVARRSQLPLAAATAGKADDYECGDQEKPARGAYLPAEDIDLLVVRFNEVGTRLAGGSLVPGTDGVTVCGDDACEGGSRSFALDPSLRRAQVLALAPEPGVVVEIDPPGDDPVRIDADGTTDIGGVQATTRDIAGRGFVIDLERPEDPAAWNGEWRASILDPSGEQEGAAGTLQVFVFSDITVEILDLTAFERGATTPLSVALVLPEGTRAEDVVASADAVVRVRNAVTLEQQTVELEGPATGPFTGAIEIPADETSNAFDVTAEVRMTTTGGAALVSQSSEREVLVRRPGGAIQFVPASLSLPSLTGEGSTATELILTGGELDGCVWFGPADIPDAPAEVGEIAFTVDGAPLPGEADCIAVPAGQSVTVLIEATPEGRDSGTVRGSLEVFEKTGDGEPSTTDLPLRFDIARGIDQARRLLLALGLLVVGLGLPMLALLLVNALTARFQTLDLIRGAAIPVQVSRRDVHRMDSGYPRRLSLREEDFKSIAHAGHDRQFTFAGVVFRAQASRNPFGATIAMAAPEGGAEKLKDKAGSRVELDPALAGSWVFLLDPDKTRRLHRGDAEGLLIAFVAEGDVSTQASRMLPDIEGRIPRIAERLAGLVRQVRPKASTKKRAAADDVAAEPDAVDDDGVDEGPVGDAPAAGGAAGGATGEAPEAAAEPAPSPTAPAEDAPPPPVGFGGAARVDPASLTSPDGGDEAAAPGDDDGPAGPPVGFSGGGPRT